MSYLWQLSGLYRDGDYGYLDFSRFELSDLDESRLVERRGIQGPALVTRYGTTWTCADGSWGMIDDSLRNGIDWNCDGDTADRVAQSINQQTEVDSPFESVLTTWNDWANLVYDGGDIGVPEDPVGGEDEVVTDPEALREIGPAEYFRIREALGVPVGQGAR
jgi:hypothetical protein